MLAITGSNGKSTVTAMTAAMCRAAGLNTVMAGNIGLPVLDAALQARESAQPDVYVVELSSFQLETTHSLRCDAAAMLNLSEDHLDRYASMAEYAEAKRRIFGYADHQVLNRDDVVSKSMRDPSRAVSTFGLSKPLSNAEFGIHEDHLFEGGSALMPLADLPVAGMHNAANALAAFALARAIGLDAARLADGLREFKGLPHRLEWVASCNGVTWYDDSKGTNVGSTVAALDGMNVPVVLIAGGIGKEQDFAPLAEPIARRARAVVLIGRDARLIEKAIASANVPVVHAESMESAVHAARKHAHPGDAVVLSPACASFDMFKNYGHRGEVFAACVRALSGEVRHVV